MKSRDHARLQRYFTKHFPSLSEAQRKDLISDIENIFSRPSCIVRYQDLPRVRSELSGLMEGKCTVEELSPVAAVYIGLDPDQIRDPARITHDRIREGLVVLEQDIRSAGGHARSRPRDERTVERVTLLCELWTTLNGRNPTHWNDEDKGPSSPCDQFVIAAFADFKEKPAWGAIRKALLENQRIDHEYGQLKDD